MCVIYVPKFIVIYWNMDKKNMELKRTIKWNGGSKNNKFKSIKAPYNLQQRKSEKGFVELFTSD